MSTKPLVWAHRGASGYAPENTLAAFQKAVDLGADGVELDIQLTKDDQIVVIHDETIDRTSDGKGWVKDYTLEELRAFNYNRTKPEYKHADIPTMREVFELLKPTGLFINIEIKTGVVFYEKIEEKILALTKEMGMEDRVCYSSFNHYSLLKMKQLDSQVQTGILFSDGWVNPAMYAKNLGINAVHPAVYHLKYPQFREEVKRAGLKMHVWTADKPEHIQIVKEAGAEAVITDYPDRAIALV